MDQSASAHSPEQASPHVLLELTERLLIRNAQLEEALESRVVIEQAKGILVERFRLGLDEAFALLRRAARSHRMRIHALAAAVVHSEATPPEIESVRRLQSRDELAALRREPVPEVRTQGDTTIITLAGEIDLHNAEAVREALLGQCEEARGPVVVDLTSVEFADSTATGILLEAQSRLDGRGRLVLVGSSAHIRRTLDFCGVDSRLPTFATLADALSSSTSGRPRT